MEMDMASGVKEMLLSENGNEHCPLPPIALRVSEIRKSCFRNCKSEQ